MLLSLLQPPSSGSLSVPCVSTTMYMAALICYCPSYNHLLLVLYQFPVCLLQCAWLLCYATVPLTTTFFWFSISSMCVHYNVHGCSAMLPSFLKPPFSGSLSVPCVSTTMCMVVLLCYCPFYNHLLLVHYEFPVCPLQCAWLLCYATVPLTTTFFWFSISSLCVHYNVHGCSTMLLSLLQSLSSGSLSVSTMCMVALLCYRPSYNNLLLVLYQFPVHPLKCAWLLCYATVPLITTFFWFSISSLCVHYNVQGCSAMLLFLLQPPSSGSLSVPHVSTTMCMVALLCYCPSYNHLLLVLYQFPVCPLQCAWLLCYATVPLTTTFFWFSISSLCVHYNVHGCCTMLLSLLQSPSSGSLSVSTMCMVALLCYRPSYNNLLLVLYQFPVRPLKCAWLLCYATIPLTTTLFWFSISSLCVHYNVNGSSAMLLSLLQPPSSGSLSVCVHYNVHGYSAMLLSLLQPPSSGSLSVPCVSTTMFMVALLCYCPSYNHLLLVLYQFPVCPLQCAWLLCYATVPLTSTFFWFSISSLCVCYNEVNDLPIDTPQSP